MKILRSFTWLCLLTGTIMVSAASESGIISGTVRDPEGRPLTAATVTLAGRSMRQATSESSGQFRFTALPSGDYALSASLTGYAASGPVSVHLKTAPIAADLVLTPQSAAPASPLEFQSSGLRGLIDPGGYSASTASASTGVLRGIAQLKRSNSSLVRAAAKEWPCALEPQLLHAAAQHPEQPGPSIRLGEFYVAHGQPVQAIPTLEHALALDSTSEQASRSLAAAWLEERNFDAAYKLLNRPVAGCDSPENHQLLAWADEGSGLFKQAADEYLRAAALSPSEESYFGIGYELLLSGLLAQANSAFADGVTRYPQSVSMQLGAGTVHFLQGDTAAALSNFLAAAETDPSDPRSYPFLAASAETDEGRRDRILRAFKHYLDLAPGSAEANLYYAIGLSHANPVGQEAYIEDLLKRAIQLNSALAQAHLQLAESYARRGDFADAATDYEATLRLTSDPEPHYRLALAYKRLGRIDDSDREMRLFRQAHENIGQQPAGGDRIDLAQFVSVINTPSSIAGSEIHCPVGPK